MKLFQLLFPDLPSRLLYINSQTIFVGSQKWEEKKKDQLSVWFLKPAVGSFHQILLISNETSTLKKKKKKWWFPQKPPPFHWTSSPFLPLCFQLVCLYVSSSVFVLCSPSSVLFFFFFSSDVSCWHCWILALKYTFLQNRFVKHSVMWLLHLKNVGLESEDSVISQISRWNYFDPIFHM